MNYKLNIERALNLLNLKFEKEFKFLPDRKFRFDYAIPHMRIAIEYEGLNFNPRTKSRHITLTGYSADCEKYNLAVINGWRVLRYTALHLKNEKKVMADLILLK